MVSGPGEISVTEVRNALRCPRVFALGRMRGQQVAFPLGASSLGSAFHRIVETAARTAGDPPERLRRLEAGARREVTAEAVAAWLLALLVRELEHAPAYCSMPAEVDDLAEALRQLASYLAERTEQTGQAPAQALERFFAEVERPVAATIATANGDVVLRGRIDALHAPADGALEVVEYKLTDETNDEVDRAQVALYRHLLAEAEGLDTAPVILRFNPGLSFTRIEPATADRLVQGTLLPLLGRMSQWLEGNERPPATERADLCPACPVRSACRETYSEWLPVRDQPPSGATRPRPQPAGALEPNVTESTTVPPEPDDSAGREEAEHLKDRIVDILRRQSAPATVPKEPIVGPRLVSVEINAARGGVRRVDKAAEDVIHQLESEDGYKAEYVKQRGLRMFRVERTEPRQVSLPGLIAKQSRWLAERPGRFVLGEGIDGSVVTGDLSEPSSCHLLVGGMTGSGKSVLLRAITASLAQLHGPSSIRFTLVDPKRVSFGSFQARMAAHLAHPLCFEVEEVLEVLSSLVDEMEDRYRLFADEHVQDIGELNEGRTDEEVLPRHVLVVDEFQDLVVTKATREPFVEAVMKLGAKARAAGIHLVLATQRPDRETVPGPIKANLPGKIGLRVQDGVNSRIVLGRKGAESLLGKGDLLADLGRDVVRAQAPLA